MREFLQKVLQYHITNGKPGSREIHGPITNDVDEIVVSAAAGQRTVLALPIETLETWPPPARLARHPQRRMNRQSNRSSLGRILSVYLSAVFQTERKKRC